MARKAQKAILALGLLAAAWTGSIAAAPTTGATVHRCHDPARLANFGNDGRIGAKWNVATQTIAFGRTAASGHFHT